MSGVRIGRGVGWSWASEFGLGLGWRWRWDWIRGWMCGMGVAPVALWAAKASDKARSLDVETNVDQKKCSPSL